MKIAVDMEKCDITVDVSELSYFSRTKRGAAQAVMDFTPMQSPPSAVLTRNIPLVCEYNGELDYIVAGRADNVYTERDVYVMETVRVVRRISERTSPFADLRFLCRNILCSYMLMREKGLYDMILRILIVSDDGEKIKGFECPISLRFAENIWSAVCKRAVPFIAIEAQRELEGKPGLSRMAFPYHEIRVGQKDFIKDAYHAAATGGRLIVCAPTGIGKTVSALYPALRAIGKGQIDKVFYLTAKTVTGNAAADAVSRMAKQVKCLRCVFITAKDRLCPMEQRDGGACAMTCSLCGEMDRVPYEVRRDGAMLSLLKDHNVITSVMIENTAKKYNICPYELSLDVSEYCEVVICDYNYVFDAKVRFKRYFEDNNGQRHMLLVDEAHNLPDRAREMYSAEVDSNVFLQLYKTENETVRASKPFMAALTEVIRQMKEIVKLCSEEETVVDDKRYGYLLSKELPEKLGLVFLQFCHVTRAFVKECPEVAVEVDKAYSMAREYCGAETYANAKFVFFAESVDGHLKASIRCLDPSEILDSMMKSARAAVLFSATLTPLEYFSDILGCKSVPLLELESPYDPDRLCVVGVSSVSTKYSVREEYVDEIAEMIFSVVEAREGNYIVYFPSYEYMRKVYKAFAENAFGCRCIVQKQGMSIAERNKFLEKFKTDREETLVGFCVLGGAFAEGVDLQGDKLIGTIIVGMGLPKLSAEQNILQNYFEETRESGYDYAYTYPAMIKVQQAAGRVIRSESDRGVVVLIDDRYAEPPVLRLMPKSWRRIKFASDPDQLASIIERFWERSDMAEE